MRLFWTVISIILTYQLIIFTGVFMPYVYENFFNKPIETYRYIFMQSITQEEPDFFYMPQRNDHKGVSINNPEKAYQGYTFLITADKNRAYLVDMDGNEVHSWEKSASEIWDQKVSKDKELYYFWLRGALNPESGNVYINPFTLDIFTENYKSITALDKNSNILWRADMPTHHDAQVQPDGSLYGLAGIMLQDADPDLPNIAPPFIEDYLIKVSADGKITKKISFLKLFKESDVKIALERISHIPQDPELHPGDVFHSNSFSVVSAEAAGKAPMLVEGHVLVSFRNLDLLVMIDPEAEKITWASYGPYKGQHSPQILDDGTVIMFDNLGNLKSGGPSRVLQLDLNDMRIVWEYTGTKENPVFSWHSSHVQKLPNGNILVTEAEAGRLFEVTPDKEIVWEYWAPSRYDFGKEDQQLIPVVFSGHRFSADEIKFLDLEKEE